MRPSGERKKHRIAAPLYKPHGSKHEKKVAANSPKSTVYQLSSKHTKLEIGEIED